MNVLSYHGDTASTGLNSSEVQLTPTNVKVQSFGKLFATQLDGQVYAQPLVDTGVTITNGVNTMPNAAGVHDVVFVATENDTLYAIDTSVTHGAILWERSFLPTGNPGSGAGVLGDQNNTLSATTIVAVPNDDTGTTDLSPVVGITSTPVIDPVTHLLYVLVKSKETIGGVAHYVQRLHAINISDGTDATAPFLVGDTFNGNTNNTPIYSYGTGDGSVTDPYNGTGDPVVQFNALRENQRDALSLVDGTVYVSWASHGDNGPYHGWVVAWDVSQVSTNGLQLKGVLDTSPNDGESGVWGGGGQLAFEPDGSAFYFMTGNGSGGAPTLGSDGFPTDGNYNEAVVKAELDSTTSPTHQNPNGWGIKIVDYFIPYNVVALDSVDSDFGSGSPLLLPDSAGIPGHPHLLIAGGKDGRLYVLDRDNLGHYDANNDNVVNSVPDGSGHNTPPNAISGTLSTPAYFNGKVYAISGYSGDAVAFSIATNGQLVPTSQTNVTSFGYLPGSPMISSSGMNNGIVWLMDRNSNEIHAYDASTLGTELWNSGQAPNGADNPGAVIKFAVPTIANGQVFVGTSNSLVVYGLTPSAGTVSSAPVLTATTLSGASINLTWTDSSLPPDTASSYLIEEATDADPTFMQVTSAPAGTTSIAIGSLAPLTKYYFRIRGFNGVGDSDYSNTVSATTGSEQSTVDFSGGFAGAGSALTLNGSAVTSGAALQLTNGESDQAGSAFISTPIDIASFTSQFTFQLSSGENIGDGFTFTIQNLAPTALGTAGAGLGYGAAADDEAGGIDTSAAIKFDLFNNSGEGPNSTGLYSDGAAPQTAGSIDLTPSGLDLHSGHLFQVNLAYDGTTLTVTIADTQTGSAAMQAYTVNIPSIVGGPTAYVGFTGGTGSPESVAAMQDILTWNYSPIASTSPNAPTGLGGSPASATAINLNWTANATNQTGYHLDRATDPDFTQNLITENLPGDPGSFTDSATGLAPGSTFYYRIRAYNAAGDSGNSNAVAVTIPLAPPKPTDQAVENVTASEIDISWTDNAGHSADGYQILRAVNNGSFSVIATLPPTSRTAPSEYEWPDTGLAPGTHYDYHIEAYNVSGHNDFAGLGATTLQIPTTTNVNSSSPTAAVGAAVTLVAAITGASSGPAPTGTVTFFAGSTEMGSVTVSGSPAVLTTSALPLGDNSITAIYSGDIGYIGSTSAPFSENVIVPALTQSLAGPASSTIIGTTPLKLSEKITITANGAPASGTQNATILLSPDQLAADSVFTLASESRKVNLKAGQSLTIKLKLAKNISAAVSPGTYHVLMSSTDTAGNELTIDSGQTITLVAPTVELSGSVIGPATAKAGKKTAFSFNVTNSSSSNIAAVGSLPFKVYTSPDGLLSDATELLTAKRSINLKPGRSVKFTVAEALNSTAFLVVSLDPENTAFPNDSNFSDNTFSRQIIVV